MQLLDEGGLPVVDITPEKLNDFFSFSLQATVVGIIGLENRGSEGLLRSLVVTESCRGQGIAAKLLGFLETYAVEQGINTLYLLTENGEAFFAKYGYVGTGRDSVPVAIQQTDEFLSICPDDALCMKKEINSPRYKK